MRPERERVAGGGSLTAASLVVIIASVFLGAITVVLGNRLATTAVLDIGPTDSRYVRDFRDIERDGPVYFRWSSVPKSSLSLPLRFCGPGALRLRVRRHFLDPAVLSVSLSGSILGQKTIRAREDHPYEVIEFQVPEVTCHSNASVLLEASVDSERELGVAVDWMEVRATKGFTATSGSVLRAAAVLGVTSAAFVAIGAGTPLTLGVSAILATGLGLSFAASPVAAERVLRGGVVALVLTLVLAALIARVIGALALPSRYRTALLALTLFTLVSRSAFLHTQAFYPDYRVHALVQQTLNRTGLAVFLDHLFEIQYERSLGLQQIDGRWYTFPYPPGAYVLAGAVGRLFSLDPLDASITTAVTFASLMPLLTVGVGISLGLGMTASLAGAFYISLQPLLVRRLALGYFPGLAGQFVDIVALLLFLAAVRSVKGASVRFPTLALTLAVAFLVYTQSIANFGLLIAGLLVVELARQSPGGRTIALRFAVAGSLALAAAVGTFYWRYLPVLENVERHQPQPESRVLDRLEELRARGAVEAAVPESDDENDPYAGSSLNPFRGIARLAARLWRFNGPFVLLLGMGAWLVLKESDRSNQNIILAWACVSIWISLLAAGLPSPNGFQHLKDLEFVAPLAALAMGLGTVRLWERRAAAALVLAAAWVLFAVAEYSVEWTGRLLPLAGL